jgi:hypothetical protein
MESRAADSLRQAGQEAGLLPILGERCGHRGRVSSPPQVRSFASDLDRRAVGQLVADGGDGNGYGVAVAFYRDVEFYFGLVEYRWLPRRGQLNAVGVCERGGDTYGERCGALESDSVDGHSSSVPHQQSYTMVSSATLVQRSRASALCHRRMSASAVLGWSEDLGATLAGRGVLPRPVNLLGRENTPGDAEIAPGQPARARKNARGCRNRVRSTSLGARFRPA